MDGEEGPKQVLERRHVEEKLAVHRVGCNFGPRETAPRGPVNGRQR